MRIEGLSFSYGDKVIFRDFSMESPSSVICIMGPSGCGKTTLLKILCGLLKAGSGKIEGIPEKCAMMFQEDRLLEWMNAHDNVALVTDSDPDPDRILRELGIEPVMQVKEMSGGMKRRVALARALAFGADALFLDEPFKGLDEDLMKKCAKIIAGCKKLTVVSTHSEAEAKALGAQILRLS